jgi:hypothetical protein
LNTIYSDVRVIKDVSESTSYLIVLIMLNGRAAADSKLSGQARLAESDSLRRYVWLTKGIAMRNEMLWKTKEASLYAKEA